ERPADVAPPTTRLHVEPSVANLNYGELVALQITPAADDLPVRIISSAPDVVRPVTGQRLVGLAAGRGQIDISQGAEIVSVQVNVTAEPYTGLSFAPDQLALKPGETVPLRVLGEAGERKDIEICA